MTKFAIALFAALVPGVVLADDADTQRILNNWDRDAAYQQDRLDRAQNYNPPGDAFYPGPGQTLNNATDGSGAIRVAR